MPRPQFSLKTMLWVVLVVGAFLAGFGWNRRQLLQERDAAQWREKQLLQAVSDYQRAVFVLDTRVENAEDRLRRLGIKKEQTRHYPVVMLFPNL
jgi:uncharacterized protein YlxW (UPF0749 family)